METNNPSCTECVTYSEWYGNHDKAPVRCSDCMGGIQRGEGLKNFTPIYPVEDVVNHPSHYTSHPSGVECITVTEHFNFCLGNAIKYLWRGAEGLKGNSVEDLKKAVWYIQREISRREG